MFCPKCGKDVGEFKFCPYCGTAVPEEQAGAWSVGMACPHCGGTRLEGDRCAFCGAQLILDGPVEEEDSFDIPYGEYGRNGQYFTLSLDHVAYRYVSLLFPQKIIIPYSSITKVVYKRSKWGSDRFEIHWDEADRAVVATPKTNVTYVSDNIRSKEYDVPYHMCYLLKLLAPSAELVIEDLRAAQVGGPDDEVMKIVDLDHYFEVYSPNRKQAAEAIRKKTGLFADLQIDKVFDQRQKELYEKDPSFVIRDMNRAIREKKRRDEIWEQESDQREAERQARAQAARRRRIR